MSCKKGQKSSAQLARSHAQIIVIRLYRRVNSIVVQLFVRLVIEFVDNET